MAWGLIRDHMAGVFIGDILKTSYKTWKMGLNRKIHYWERAPAVEGIAVNVGLGKFDRWRVTPATSNNQGFDAVQIIYDDRVKELFEALPVWMP